MQGPAGAVNGPARPAGATPRAAWLTIASGSVSYSLTIASGSVSCSLTIVSGSVSCSSGQI
ncbi:hypothetical protein [Biostraticola tofi]|uniref:hypothetical protein n=1 Tax=Biostraticola tofi TaxID=466109 RepID=UPI00104B767D|nr:hypothetical protein [Biostraticola tofi]